MSKLYKQIFDETLAKFRKKRITEIKIVTNKIDAVWEEPNKIVWNINGHFKITAGEFGDKIRIYCGNDGEIYNSIIKWLDEKNISHTTKTIENEHHHTFIEIPIAFFNIKRDISEIKVLSTKIKGEYHGYHDELDRNVRVEIGTKRYKAGFYDNVLIFNIHDLSNVEYIKEWLTSKGIPYTFDEGDYEHCRLEINGTFCTITGINPYPGYDAEDNQIDEIKINKGKLVLYRLPHGGVGVTQHPYTTGNITNTWASDEDGGGLEKSVVVFWLGRLDEYNQFMAVINNLGIPYTQDGEPEFDTVRIEIDTKFIEYDKSESISDDGPLHEVKIAPALIPGQLYWLKLWLAPEHVVGNDPEMSLVYPDKDTINGQEGYYWQSDYRFDNKDGKNYVFKDMLTRDFLVLDIAEVAGSVSIDRPNHNINEVKILYPSNKLTQEFINKMCSEQYKTSHHYENYCVYIKNNVNEYYQINYKEGNIKIRGPYSQESYWNTIINNYIHPIVAEGNWQRWTHDAKDQSKWSYGWMDNKDNGCNLWFAKLINKPFLTAYQTQLLFTNDEPINEVKIIYKKITLKPYEIDEDAYNQNQEYGYTRLDDTWTHMEYGSRTVIKFNYDADKKEYYTKSSYYSKGDSFFEEFKTWLNKHHIPFTITEVNYSIVISIPENNFTLEDQLNEIKIIPYRIPATKQELGDNNYSLFTNIIPGEGVIGTYGPDYGDGITVYMFETFSSEETPRVKKIINYLKDKKIAYDLDHSPNYFCIEVPLKYFDIKEELDEIKIYKGEKVEAYITDHSLWIIDIEVTGEINKDVVSFPFNQEEIEGYYEPMMEEFRDKGIPYKTEGDITSHVIVYVDLKYFVDNSKRTKKIDDYIIHEAKTPVLKDDDKLNHLLARSFGGTVDEYEKIDNCIHLDALKVLKQKESSLTPKLKGKYVYKGITITESIFKRWLSEGEVTEIKVPEFGTKPQTFIKKIVYEANKDFQSWYKNATSALSQANEELKDSSKDYAVILQLSATNGDLYPSVDDNEVLNIKKDIIVNAIVFHIDIDGTSGVLASVKEIFSPKAWKKKLAEVKIIPKRIKIEKVDSLIPSYIIVYFKALSGEYIRGVLWEGDDIVEIHGNNEFMNMVKELVDVNKIPYEQTSNEIIEINKVYFEFSKQLDEIKIIPFRFKINEVQANATNYVKFNIKMGIHNIIFCTWWRDESHVRVWVAHDIKQRFIYELDERKIPYNTQEGLCIEVSVIYFEPLPEWDKKSFIPQNPEEEELDEIKIIKYKIIATKTKKGLRLPRNIDSGFINNDNNTVIFTTWTGGLRTREVRGLFDEANIPYEISNNNHILGTDTTVVSLKYFDIIEDITEIKIIEKLPPDSVFCFEPKQGYALHAGNIIEYLKSEFPNTDPENIMDILDDPYSNLNETINFISVTINEDKEGEYRFFGYNEKVEAEVKKQLTQAFKTSLKMYF